MILFNIGIVPPCLNPKLDTDKTIKKSQIKLSYEKVAELVKIPARITWAHGATNITPICSITDWQKLTPPKEKDLFEMMIPELGIMNRDEDGVYRILIRGPSPIPKKLGDRRGRQEERDAEIVASNGRHQISPQLNNTLFWENNSIV
ncbi:hypothetical protein OUZ56_029855 [Daphnia magna]|uniref:Uncharacterized protein n=1 Tax=Daphnia magna TaxID=35525 RepID=A0ABR0B800_9CRUS|nr:hypothetical protein OUZ56_029855 [Daphnia magna]